MVDCKLGKCGEEDCGYVVIVVSPLISLMIEQVQRLHECEVSFAILGVDVGSTRVPRELLAKEHNHLLIGSHCVRHYWLKILNNVGFACVHTLPRFPSKLCTLANTTCTRPSSPGTQEGLGTRLIVR